MKETRFLILRSRPQYYERITRNPTGIAASVLSQALPQNSETMCTVHHAKLHEDSIQQFGNWNTKKWWIRGAEMTIPNKTEESGVWMGWTEPQFLSIFHSWAAICELIPCATDDYHTLRMRLKFWFLYEKQSHATLDPLSLASKQ
jgi:hypothetical protein